MATVTPDQNPVVLDTVLFSLPTPDANGCFLADPYMVNSVVVYFVERDFASPNLNDYNIVTQDQAADAAANAAEAVACANPTDANIQSAKTLRAKADSLATTTPFFYNNANPVTVVGNATTFPAWLSTDPNNAFIDHITTDANGNTIYGQFQYAWNSYGMREGDYFVCWTWTPNPAGDSLSSSVKFTLGGNSVVTTAIPTHYTQPDKYATLLERYLPEMFKMQLTSTDRTPDILDKFNQAVADGFTAVENLATQVVDLQDANSTAEVFLPLLAKFFGITLKTDDPALWRRQIKQAIPLFKKKGTAGALKEALAQAGILMNKLVRLWQVISSYTWQEAFTFDGTTDTWTLSKVALPLDQNNFGLWLRPADQNTYIQLASDYISFGTDAEGNSTITWEGSGLTIDPIDLVHGDIIRVLYLYNAVPDAAHQTIENYVRSLPLADQRDETHQQYPLKNWNVRVMEEDDPLFDLIIPDREPYVDPLVFGKVRTEFPYSENAYNADEYNGSIRNSTIPCDIDKHFLDPCSACLSSKFNIYLEIENLSNNRILEAQDVILEFTPFHAQLQTLNFAGGITEFVTPPLEDVEALVNVSGGDFVICGQGQMWFNRAMKGGLTTNIIDRSMLANSDIPIASQAGTAYNSSITVWCPEVEFDDIGLALDGTPLLEILAPSPSAGTYTLSSPIGNTAIVTGASEPVNGSAFTFRVSNILTSGTQCNIFQADVVTLIDVNNSFASVLSNFDVIHNGATGPYTVTILAYSTTPYQVDSVRPDGSLVLLDHGETLPTSGATSVVYTLKDQNGATVLKSSTGALTVVNRGRVQTLNTSVQDVHNLLAMRQTCYFVHGGSQYLIDGFVSPTDAAQFYIDGYTGGDVAGTTLTIYQRLVDNQIGYLSHRGLMLKTSGNLETTLNIQNGTNPPATPLQNNDFMENYIITINNQDYFISMINGNSPPGSTTITLAGPDNYWKTLGAGGTSVNFMVTHFTKIPITVPGQQFDLAAHTFPTYDRGGREVITEQINSNPPVSVSLTKPGAGLKEIVEQSEGVSFEIEWADGSKDTGNI